MGVSLWDSVVLRVEEPALLLLRSAFIETRPRFGAEKSHDERNEDEQHERRGEVEAFHSPSIRRRNLLDRGFDRPLMLLHVADQYLLDPLGG